jgi:RNA polymerase sigma-70 factor (family 1)
LSLSISLETNLLTLEISEREFVTALRTGDEVVFEQVFRDYYERLCNYANTIIKDAAEAEEMVQGTFLTLWETRARIEIHTSIKSYLYRSVHNSCLNRIKHFKVRGVHDEYYKYVTEVSFDSTSQQLLGDELQQQINKAIETMPQQCRTVFILSRYENLTYSEIAEQLDISVKTVDKHICKALKIMRERLKDYMPILILFLMSKN